MRNKEDRKIQIALIGYGYWGKILVSKLINHPHFELKYICDLKPFDLKPFDVLSLHHPPIEMIQDQSIILNDPDIQAVLIAVPPMFHFQVAKACLLSKKHVWLEKPACRSLEEFEILKSLSLAHQCILHVDYLYLFNPLIQKIKALIQSSEIISFHAIRMNQNHIGASAGFEEEIDLIYDLGVHDLSIFRYLVPQATRFQFKHQMNSQNHVLTLVGEMDDVNDQMSVQMNVQIDLSWRNSKKIRRLLLELLNGSMIEFTLDDQGGEVLNVFGKGGGKESVKREAGVIDMDKGVDYIQYQQQFDSLKQSLVGFREQILRGIQEQTLWEVTSSVHQMINHQKIHSSTNT